MNKLSYAEQLQHPLWQKRKTEILTRDKFMCQNCANTEEQLHVHHRWYVSGRNAWEYPDHALVTLCKTCHGNAFAVEDRWWELLVCEFVKSIETLSKNDPFVAADFRRMICNIARSGGLNEYWLREFFEYFKYVELATEGA